MKKWLFIAGAVIGSSAVGTAWYTGTQYDEILQTQWLTAQQQAELSIDITVTEQGLFSRTEQFHMTVTNPEFDQPIELYIQQNLRFWPLYISADMRIDLSQGSLAQLQSYIEQAPTQSGGWTASVLSQSGQHNFQLGPMRFSPEPGVTVTLEPIEFSGSFALDMSSSSGTTTLQSIEFQADDAVLEIGPVMMEVDSVLVDNVYDIPNFAMSIASLQFKNDEQLQLTNLVISSQSTEHDSSKTFANQIAVEQFHFESPLEQTHIRVDQLRFNSALAGLNADAYRRLVNLGQLDADKMEAEAMQALDQLIDKGLQWQLSEIGGQVDIALPGQIIKGEFDSRGRVDLAPIKFSELIHPMMALAKLDAEIDLTISDAMFAEHPFGPMLPQLVEAGYLKQSEAKLTTQFAFKQGVATFNGLQFAL
ncbi:DUF945 family protein [Ferrimonas pelagia]|uniref:DUF945 domain-containing protein n=1 Tax=Ferrimonas pelagia TaxID=1177826 RepID=A0ABP9EH42_9GAMM